MKALRNLFVLMLASFALASCGGGGNGSNSAFGGAPVLTVSVSASPASITTNSFTTLTVTVKNPDGSPAANGAAVQATLNPSTIGSLSAGSASGSTVSAPLSGGTASFIFNSSNQTGTAKITASVTVNTTGSVTGTVSYTGSVNVNVTPGNSQDPRLTLSPTAVSLPLNPYAGQAQIFPFPSNYLGSPWISEVTVTWRHSNGQLVAGTTKVNVSIDPVTLASFSTLDDPTTPWTGQTKNPPTFEGNEFLTLLGSGPVNVTGGNGVIFVHADDIPGTAVLSVVAIDPDSGQTITSQLPITIAGASSNLPSSITASSDSPAYVTGSGGPQSALVRAAVTDGNNALVPDPSGFDNVEFTIVGPSGTDARLTGINAAGQSVTGGTIDTVTHNGIATITVQSGSQQGPVQIKATADRGDGNVDNGIQDAVSSTATVVISDGKLFSLKITNPAIDPNLLPVVGDATSSGSATPTPVYTVPVTVLGTDRQGNPVLPGTQIAFGLLDAPVFGFPDSGSGTFEISGSNGNPQEGATLFTAPSGAFTTAGGGAGPGDALVVFGKETTGDADLESARTVRTINNSGSLNVTQSFNLNDTTGSSVDTGSNIPYVIGRATAGNIDASAFTGVDSNGLPDGIAAVTMRYPQSRIGQSAVVWAQGTGTTQGNGVAKTVADAIRTRYLGIGPAVLTATPSTIFGNTTQTVAVCLNDSVGSPIPGVIINFNFASLSPGTGTVNGLTAGALPPTGASGCVDTTVVTSGVQPGSAAKINFTVSGLSASVAITVGNAVLTANPTLISSNAGATAKTYGIALSLKDGLGNPVSGASITGSCSGGGTATLNSPWVTDTNGSAGATLTASGFCALSGTPATSVCTFTYSNGTANATATTTITGVSASAFSPPLTCM